MEFVNPHRNVKKMSSNIYSDLETAWAEYEYVVHFIKSKVLEILEKDTSLLKNKGHINDEIHYDVKIQDTDIIITVYPGLCMRTIQELNKFLGTEGKILSSGTKKNKKIQLIYEHYIKDEKTQQSTFDTI